MNLPITEVATEPTEVVTEAATEPTEATPEVTQPVTTSKPSTGTSTGTNTGNVSNSSGTTTATPTVTEPVPTEHIHSWQEVYHEEVSHDVWWVVCTCGARFTTTAEWGAHVDGFSLADAMSAHSGNHSSCETVIDTPAYSTWVCACGATSDTQP